MILKILKKNKNTVFVLLLLLVIVLIINCLNKKQNTEVVSNNLNYLDAQFPYPVYEGFTLLEKAIISFSEPIGTDIIQAEFAYGKNENNVKEELLLGVNKNDEILLYDEANKNWHKLRGNLNNICSKGRDLIVGVTRNGDIFYTKSGFKYVDAQGNETFQNQATTGSSQVANAGTQNLRRLKSDLYWERLPSIKKGKTKMLSVGFDGTIVAINILTSNTKSSLVSEVYKYNAPRSQDLDQDGKPLNFNEGTWEKIGQNLQYVDVRNENEMWGTTFVETVLKYDKSQNQWLNIPGNLMKISVGEDGAVWGVDSDNYLFMLNKKNNWDLMDKKRRYIDVDVRDNSKIVCIDTSRNVILGEVSGFPSIPEPVESPFQAEAYSCAHNGYKSEAQKTKTPKATLEVNYDMILDGSVDNTKTRKENYADGYIMVAVDEYGREMFNKTYKLADGDTGATSRAELPIKNPDTKNIANINNAKVMLKDFSSLKVDKRNVESKNIVNEFMPELPNNVNKSDINNYFRMINRYKNHVMFFQGISIGYYGSVVESEKTYNISFKYKISGNDKTKAFNIFSKGADGSVFNEALEYKKIDIDNGFQTYNKKYKFKQGGDFNIYFTTSGVGGQILEIKEVSIKKEEELKKEASIIYIMTEGKPMPAEGNYKSKDLTDFYNGMQKFGFTKIPDIRTTSSYVAVYSVPRNYLLFEELSNGSDVTFVSEGKTPVIDSAFSKGNVLKDTPESYEKYLTHLKESVLWSLATNRILQESTADNEVIPQITNLNAPFNQRIDSAINILDETGNTRQVLLTRGALYIKYDIKQKKVVSGPNKIGTDILKVLNQNTNKVHDIFKKGIDAGCGMDNGKYLLFRGKHFAILDENMTNVEVIGKRDDSNSPFIDLPENFKNKVDAAVNVGGSDKNKLYIFSGDLWIRVVRQSDNTFKIDLGPDSLVTHPNFNNLPLSYRLGLNKLPPEPFLNHSKFTRNALHNYDITVKDGGLRGLPGWDKRNFISLKNPVTNKMMPSYNRNVVYNYEKPPIIVSRYKSMNQGRFDDKTTNQILEFYEKVGKKSKAIVNRYGGNTVTFSLYEDQQTKKRKGQWVASGDRANLLPGNFYKFSIWAKTSNPTLFRIKPIIGDVFKQSKYDDNFEYKEIINSQGWQLLEWNKQLKADELYKNISYVYEQGDNDNSIHSLYGPIAKPLIRYPDPQYINDLIGNTVVGQSNVFSIICLIKNVAYNVYLHGTKIKNADNNFQVNTCREEKCSQKDGLVLPHERFIFYKRQKITEDEMPDRYIISSSYLTSTKAQGSNLGGGLNLTINKKTKKAELTTETTNDIDFYILINDNNQLMFLHIDTNTFLTFDGNSLIGMDPLDNPNKMNKSTFNVTKLGRYIESKKSEGFTNYGSKRIYENFQVTDGVEANKEPDHISYIQAICPYNYSEKNSDSYVYLFRNHQFCIYDLETKGYVLSTNARKNHSTFAKLPKYWSENMNVVDGEKVAVYPGFDKNIDAAFSIHPESDIVYLFNKNFFIIWDLSEGNYADPKTLVEKYGYPNDIGNDKPYVMGPGSIHPWFSRLPAPFNKRIDAAFNADGGNKVVLISSGFWCLWDLSTHEIVDLNKDNVKITDTSKADSDIRPLQGLKAGWARGISKRISSNIDAAIAIPNRERNGSGYQKGEFYLFSGKQFKVCRFKKDNDGNIDYLQDCSEEPSGGSSGYFLGSHVTFKNLPKEFKPNKAELCKAYLRVTKANTDIPKEECKIDPNAEYQWIDYCPYLDDGEKYCKKAGGEYNDEKGMCSTPSEKDAKYKKTQKDLRDKFQLLYEKECREISKYDNDDMNTKETARNVSKNEEINEQIRLIGERNNSRTTYNSNYQDLIKKHDYMPGVGNNDETIKREDMYLDFFGEVDSENVKNINSVEKLLKDRNVGFKQREEYWKSRACEPVRTCRPKPVTDKFKIPESCKTPQIKTLLEKLKKGDPLTDGDITIIGNIIQKNVLVDDYPIQKHPDYSKFISSKFVKGCPGLNIKDIGDFNISEFSNGNQYILRSELKPSPPVKVTRQQYTNRRVVANRMSRGGQSASDMTTAERDAYIEKKYSFIMKRIENGTLILEDITKVLRNDKEIKELLDYFKRKNMENFQDYVPPPPNVGPTGMLRLLDILVQKNIYGRDARNFIGWLSLSSKYREMVSTNLLQLNELENYNNKLENAIRDYNLNNPNNKIGQSDTLNSQSVGTTDVNGCNLQTQRYCQAFNSCIPIDEIGTCPVEDSQSGNAGSVSGTQEERQEERGNVLNNLNKTINRLEKRIKEVLENLNKCNNGTKITELKSKLDQLISYRDELKSKLKDAEKNRKNANCKKLGDYKIEDHPDFAKNNYNIPCWGCSEKKVKKSK